MLNKKNILWYSFISVSGWLFAAYLMFMHLDSDRDFINDKITVNAYNIVSQSLQDKKSDQEIIEQIQFWFKNGWTAQTGSVTTICNNDRKKFKQILSDSAIVTICRLHI
ncbi:hypothetical protein [Photobacterium andalusiense]|uniref:Uncharacterized protein n=1 Tax=Photobacterium andalusiense TaxID=2204296 RepID=A0A1Y6M6K2_9GAMM|nr:hypothetical protein [Photobacterium andalusiense]SMY32217.1 hypothetical protein PAND9192_00318 [Photobacterium andalusiense]